jgi:type II secretion system protein N
MSTRLNKALKYTGYVAFGFFVLVVTAYLSFPFNRLKDLIAEEVSQGGRYKVTIGSVGPAFLAGVTLRDVELVSPPEKPKEKPSRMRIDEATVKFGLWSLMAGEPEVSFDVEAFGGTIEGETQKSDGTRRIEFEVSNIAFDRMPGLSKSVGIPMSGRVSGRARIKIPRDGLRKMDGKITLRCKGCTFGDGKTKIKPKFVRSRPGKYNPVAEKGVTLPKIRLGRFGGDIEIEDGKASFSQFEALSPDGEAVVDGYILLREPIVFSTVQAVFKFKLSEEIKKRKPKVLGIEASMARGKRQDGYYGMCITRRLKNLRFRPCRYSAAERGGGRYNRRRRRSTGRRRRRGGALRNRRRRRTPSPPRRPRPPRPPRPHKRAPSGRPLKGGGGRVEDY